MPQITLISERTQQAFKNYYAAKWAHETGGMTLAQREESRTCAVELVIAIGIENPEVTGHGELMEKIKQLRTKKN